MDPLPVGSNWKLRKESCETMPRLTITLADRTHRALKKAAARQGYPPSVPCPQLLKRAWK